MAFNGTASASNTNEKRRPSLNTFGENFTNYDNLCKLSFTYSNSLLNVIITPLKSASDYIGDPQRAVGISISARTASQVADELYDAKGYFKEGKPFNTSITCGTKTTNMIAVSDGTAYGLPYGIYLALFEELDSYNKPKRSAVYSLRNSSVIEGYNPETGDGKKVARPFRELKDIANTFEDFARTSNKAIAHNTHYNLKWSLDSRLGSAQNLARAIGHTGEKKDYSNNSGVSDIFEETLDIVM